MYQDYKKIQITTLFNYLFLLFKTQKMEIYRIQTIPLGEKCSYLEFFWSVFSRTWLKYVSLRIQAEWRKKRTGKTPDTDIFHAMYFFEFL